MIRINGPDKVGFIAARFHEVFLALLVLRLFVIMISGCLYCRLGDLYAPILFKRQAQVVVVWAIEFAEECKFARLYVLGSQGILHLLSFLPLFLLQAPFSLQLSLVLDSFVGFDFLFESSGGSGASWC